MPLIEQVNPVLAAPPPAAAARPELLAPAGDWQCARAAVENGADAIYFGLERFNARMRAQNFTETDLPGLMEFLHRRGVKGYVTFNTLVFANELAQAVPYLRALIAVGVDAAIVQDVGICRLIRQLSPDFPIHASTQMTITSRAGVEFAREIGCNLVVLARECSLKEIHQINGRADSPESQPSLPLEVFVHGALCVAYSGQCLTSESLGGRSANRGECAQACRMPYELICDDKPVALGDRRYLLSPQDLAGLPLLADLIQAGVASLKIEGRLKTPEYVANITGVYRRALDEIFKPAGGLSPAGGDLWEKSRYDLEMGFSRGLFTGWLGGTNNQKLVHARFGKKRGVFLGLVDAVDRDTVRVQLQAPLKAGDGVVFDAGRPDENEEGARVHEIMESSTASARCATSTIRFGRGDIAFDRVHVGDKLWKTSDPQLDQRLRQTFSGQTPLFQRPLALEVHGRAGVLLTLVGRDEMGHVVRIDSSIPLQAARKQPLTPARLEAQLGRLGGTPFQLASLKSLLEGEVILPMSELNRLRRALVARLEDLRAQPKRWRLNPGGFTAPGLALESDPARPAPGPARLRVLVRNLAQLEAALGCDVSTLYCEFEDPKKYRQAVARFRDFQTQGGNPHSEILVAPPRIFKTGEEWILNLVRSSGADGWLVRNYDHLRFFDQGRRVGDYSLNVANGFSAQYFKNRFALQRLTASYDLNIVQLEALLQSAPPEWFEITIHQHMPMFHMEHCVFCAFLSSGADYRDCGRPCDNHDVQLRDRVGLAHPLKADAGCRNTVFNGRAQTGAEYVRRLMALGARDFRLEFLNESPAEVIGTISKYRELIEGQITSAQLWRQLNLHNQLGVTRGPMEK